MEPLPGRPPLFLEGVVLFGGHADGAVEADDLVVAGTLARHSRSRVVANLPAVPFDADAIVSGDYLTTYAEFTAAFGVLL